MILLDKKDVSKDGAATQQCHGGSRFSLSSCSAILSRWCLMVTRELPQFQPSYLHPRVLTAGWKVEVREAEPKGSLLTCLFIWERNFSQRFPVESSFPCVGGTFDPWQRKRITMNNLDQSCLPREAGHINI